MCVIIIRPAGKMPPSDTTLLAAYKANPHGCGFVTPKHHYKGLDFGSFISEFHKVQDDEPCIIHFRLATHGSISEKNCHPFRRGNVFFAHNGILDIEPMSDMTDSETALQTTIYPAIKRYGWNTAKSNKIINDVCGASKFALMSRGRIITFGTFTQMPDGCFYSNLRFLGYLNPY